MLWGENRGKWKRPVAAGSRTQDTPGLSCQCSATEPRQPDNHQPSQSSTCTALVGYWMPQSHTWQPLSMDCEGWWLCWDAYTANKWTSSGHTTQNTQCQQRHIDCNPCQQFDGIWLSPRSTNMPSSQDNHNANVNSGEAYVCNRFRLMSCLYIIWQYCLQRRSHCCMHALRFTWHHQELQIQSEHYVLPVIETFIVTISVQTL